MGGGTTFCLEYDRSTETLDRLVAKLDDYVQLQIASEKAYWVLFCFRNPRREAGARRALAEATVPVATAELGRTQRPHEAIWAPIGYDGPRMRLAELSGVPHPPSPTNGLQRPRSAGAGTRNSGENSRRGEMPRPLHSRPTFPQNQALRGLSSTARPSGRLPTPGRECDVTADR